LKHELTSLQSNHKEANRQLDSNKKAIKRMQKELDGSTKEQQELLNEVFIQLCPRNTSGVLEFLRNAKI